MRTADKTNCGSKRADFGGNGRIAIRPYRCDTNVAGDGNRPVTKAIAPQTTNHIIR
jgi:hypothetical protein